jgi:hypothetical protein
MRAETLETTDRADHVLNIDESDNRPSLATVIDTSEPVIRHRARVPAFRG